jgi:hypothetical protein
MIQKDLIYIVSAGLCNLIPFDPAWRVFCLCSRSCNKTAKFRNTNKINFFFKVTNLKNVWTRDINTRHFWPKCLRKEMFSLLWKKRIGKNIKNHDRQTDRTAGCWRDSNNFYLVKLYHIYTHTHTLAMYMYGLRETRSATAAYIHTWWGEGGKGKTLENAWEKRKHTHKRERAF